MIDKDTVLHVAQVARVKLTEEEVELFSQELSEVLDAFSKLSEVDTKNLEPSLHPIPLTNAFRDDTIEESLSVEEALKNTEHKKDNYFMGPRAV